RSRPLSDRLRPSPDAPRSLARCAAVAIRVVPGQLLVVFSLRSRRCSYRRRLHAYVEINVPDLILVGRFSSDPHWPVLGDRWGNVAGDVDEFPLTPAFNGAFTSDSAISAEPRFRSSPPERLR